MPSDAAHILTVDPPTDGAAVDPGIGLPSVDALLDDGAADASVDTGPHLLPLIALAEKPALASAVRRLVQQKERLDALAGDALLRPLLPPDWLGSNSRSIDMTAFLHAVLPFLQSSVRGESAAARLPLPQVLGDSARWGHNDVEEPRSLAWFLASDERAKPSAKDPAEAFVVGALGLAWMHSGRSRVPFLRAMGVESVAARCTMLDFPPADSLALYSVVAQGQARLWCVQGRRGLRELTVPGLSVPLLNAYGVAAPQPWPGNYPAVEEVAHALAAARQGRLHPEVELTKVAAKVAQDASGEAWQPVSLLQLRTWQPRWGFFLSTFVALPSLLLLAAALVLPRAVEAATVAASLGFAAGAVGALAAPWVHARRKHLR